MLQPKNLTRAAPATHKGAYPRMRSAPVIRFETCAHVARMWQLENLTRRCLQPTDGSPGGSRLGSDRVRGAGYDGHPCPSASRPQPLRSPTGGIRLWRM